MMGRQEPTPGNIDSYLPLPASTMHIIVALADGPRHGYAIMRDIEDLHDGSVTIGPGTLYGSIKRMIERGLVEETDDRPDPALDDQRRRYYRLTNLGHRVGAAEQARLATLLNAAQLRQLGLNGAT